MQAYLWGTSAELSFVRELRPPSWMGKCTEGCSKSKLTPRERIHQAFGCQITPSLVGYTLISYHMIIVMWRERETACGISFKMNKKSMLCLFVLHLVFFCTSVQNKLRNFWTRKKKLVLHQLKHQAHSHQSQQAQQAWNTEKY